MPVRPRGPAPATTSARQLRQLDEVMLTLATSFINLPVAEIDGAIEAGLQRVVRALGVDRCAISRKRGDAGDLRVSHIWPAADYPRAATPAVEMHWPWAYARLCQGEVIAFTRLDDLPPEAHADRRTWQAMGTLSHVSVPLMTAGELVAILHMGSFRVERAWPQTLLARLRRLAEIFAIALTRKHAQEALDHVVGFERAATRTLAALLTADPAAQGDAIDSGLAELGRLQGADCTALWERDATAPGGWRRTHQWLDDPGDRVGPDFGAAGLGWFGAALAAGRPVQFARLHDLPAEAAPDLPALRAMGVCSMLAVPVSTPDEVAGVLTCANLREERAWPDSMLHGATLLAEVFASVRARRVAERREQAAVMDAAQWRERLAHLVRVHTVGEMSAALTHEINQPLMAIANYALAARRRASELPRSDKVVELLDKVVAQTSRAGDVVGRLRGMVKRSDVRLAAIDLEHLIGECVDMVRMECDLRDIRLECRIASPLPALVADGIQLQQVVLNLLRNAIEAMEPRLPDQPREIVLDAAAVGDRDVVVRVADRGSGISDGDLERVFEAFYSTKATGLGIGLSLCRKLIEAHGGTLSARNRDGGGAEFHFTLPLADGGMG